MLDCRASGTQLTDFAVMPSRIVLIDPARPRDERVAPSVEVLRGGGIVAVPTETFYGLAADSGHTEAVVGVNRLKGKPDDSPCLLLIADVEQAAAVAPEPPEAFFLLSRRFWPGPLTLVVPAREDQLDGNWVVRSPGSVPTSTISPLAARRPRWLAYFRRVFR